MGYMLRIPNMKEQTNAEKERATWSGVLEPNVSFLCI